MIKESLLIKKEQFFKTKRHIYVYILIFFRLIKLYGSVIDAKNTKSTSNYALCYTNSTGKVEFGIALRFLKKDKHVYSIVKTANKSALLLATWNCKIELIIFFIWPNVRRIKNYKN
jgi:hypothetical protein